MAGLRKREQLTLKRGVATRNVWDWYTRISQGREDAREIRITMLDESRKPVLRWRIVASGEGVQLDGILIAEFDGLKQCRVFREWWHQGGQSS